MKPWRSQHRCWAQHQLVTWPRETKTVSKGFHGEFPGKVREPHEGSKEVCFCEREPEVHIYTSEMIRSLGSFAMLESSAGSWQACHRFSRSCCTRRLRQPPEYYHEEMTSHILQGSGKPDPLGDTVHSLKTGLERDGLLSLGIQLWTRMPGFASS
ncbi:hypothetical protein BCR41DRAFT_373825 [Lobosporangium transversale]|uniref:Uncharacterized protein n=1 Tax=Lobosporangium transversale TaxID=64571 RepID=A0A1Y2GCJ9_9FUNG|nr:hypothetical protein BCR41DRAFT_373825 [Lobosporangium transversale]ORZ07048.1 hypothetical protein BCR41DRAFT_373825 [Lobosporangium transversale]|eukprot:XP_021877844.1 hypothetical protein BCR41DRAFT_373825 [Lobosporangium transversale]